MKISLCKELNYYDHYDILEKIEKDKFIKFLSKIGFFTSLTLHKLNRRDLYVIIHPCSKKKNYFQVSYFDSNGAISDEIYPTRDDCLFSVFKRYPVVKDIVK